MSEEMFATKGNMGPMPVNPSCPNGQLYTVKSGDTMFTISRQFNVSLQSLVDANPQISDPNLIFPGQIICVPMPASEFCTNGTVYTVVKGDTMYNIAKRNGITLDALIAANPQIKDANLIFPGDKICIPVKPIVCPGGTLYTVKTGDTLFNIARSNNITLAALIAANPQITDPNLILPGQVICIPKMVVGPVITPPVVEQPPLMPVFPPVVSTPTLPCPTPLPTTLPMPPVTATTLPAPVAPTAIAPCQPGYETPMMYPMPVYIVVPWEQCPFRSKKKKHERDHYCR